MIVRGAGRAMVGLALLLAVSACDDNPLAEDRETASYFRLNPSNVAVNAGGKVAVDANILNRYGAALDEAVSATSCDAKVSAAPDTTRSAFEYPERFIITGNTVGESCVVVSGGGITDTIVVRVVPASVDLALSAPGDTLLQSGDQVTLTIAYLGATGSTAAGVSLDDRTTFTVVNGPVGSIDENGLFTAREAGTTWVRATWTDMGVTRRDSVQITVIPAVFTGTAVQAAYGGGQVIEFTAGGIPFDANTRVEFPDMSPGDFVHLLPNTTIVRAAIPPGTPSGTVIRYFILNAGPNDATVEGTFTTTAAAPATDPFLNQTSATARAMAVGEDMFGTIAGVRGSEEWFVVNVAEAGTYTVEFAWDDGDDKDLYLIASDGTTLVAEENGSSTNPEHATLDLQPGTYYIIGSTWTPNPGDAAYYRMRFVKE